VAKPHETPSHASTELPDTEPDLGARRGADALPEFVAHYRIVEELAAGGFGVVYRAEHTHTGDEVAIKILHPELAASEATVRRFEREVEIMNRVRHPSIVEVIEFGRLAGSRPYFVMELLHGRTLRQHLGARGRLAVDEVIEILAPVVDALAAAHAQAVVHRDVKPSNIFLAERDGRARVLLLDFGVAKLLDASAPGLTTSRHTVGTFACMAPEQLLAGQIDARTDVYALGVLAYTMLTGHPPFDSAPYVVMQHLHLHARPPRPSSRAPLHHAFDDVVLRAMNKRPDDRQPSVGAFLEEMRAAVDRAAGRDGAATRLAESRVLAVRFEGRLDGDVGDDAEAAYLDLESLPAVVLAELGHEGLELAMDAGTTLVLTLDRPIDPAADLAARVRAIRAVAALARSIARRPGLDPRVRADFQIHAATAVREVGGELVGGELMDFVAGAPESGTAPGILVSTAALAGLTAETTPIGDEGPIHYVRLALDSAIEPAAGAPTLR
jgi:serine/threonine-protein kinase